MPPPFQQQAVPHPPALHNLASVNDLVKEGKVGGALLYYLLLPFVTSMGFGRSISDSAPLIHWHGSTEQRCRCFAPIRLCALKVARCRGRSESPGVLSILLDAVPVVRLTPLMVLDVSLRQLHGSPAVKVHAASAITELVHLK